ncbi:hypothetical protein A3860_14835 [Niastella vici]|uniref:Lipoprotein n=1 Tax=Niastella vici TaxID=1703345 RepID=A0A1V9G5L0_9BACT|nr:hypothetical protein [Niastella vici]OQP65867.1 hypothetical protein A3860_14835 [Niastella vici]
MSNKILFVITVLFISCGDLTPQSGAQDKSTIKDSASRPLLTIDSNRVKDNSVHLSQKSVSTINCHDLLHSLIDKSSFDPEIKKLGFGVWVDTVHSGIAIIQITVHNTERNDDPIIGWVKIDFNDKKLWDISIDPEKELGYDTVLFRELDEKCLVR